MCFFRWLPFVISIASSTARDGGLWSRGDGLLSIRLDRFPNWETRWGRWYFCTFQSHARCIQTASTTNARLRLTPRVPPSPVALECLSDYGSTRTSEPGLVLQALSRNRRIGPMQCLKAPQRQEAALESCRYPASEKSSLWVCTLGVGCGRSRVSVKNTPRVTSQER